MGVSILSAVLLELFLVTRKQRHRLGALVCFRHEGFGHLVRNGRTRRGTGDGSNLDRAKKCFRSESDLDREECIRVISWNAEFKATRIGTRV